MLSLFLPALRHVYLHRGFRSVAIWLVMVVLSGMVAWYTNLFYTFTTSLCAVGSLSMARNMPGYGSK